MNTHVSQDGEMLDAGFCRRKEAEYYAKSRATTDPKLTSAYEAAAREYAYRVRLIGSKKTMGLG
jgi:hypothetical protein